MLRLQLLGTRECSRAVEPFQPSRSPPPTHLLFLSLLFSWKSLLASRILISSILYVHSSASWYRYGRAWFSSRHRTAKVPIASVVAASTHQTFRCRSPSVPIQLPLLQQPAFKFLYINRQLVLPIVCECSQ